MRKKYTKTADSFFKNIRDNNGIKERKCTQCEEWFPETIEYFYMHNKSKPEKGYQAECKVCARKRSFENKWANIEKAHEADRKYKEKHKEKIKREKKIWVEKNYERHIETREKWFLKNPDKVKEYNEKRQHKNHKINKTEWENCKKYFDYQCAYCGLPISEHYYTRKGVTKLGDLHKEHVDHEGTDGLSNCIPSCGSCNDKKWMYAFDDWYNEENLNYTEERYDKIMKWLMEDHFQYIEEYIPKRKYTRKIKQEVAI